MDRTELIAAALFEHDERENIESSADLAADPSLWMAWGTANEPTRAPYRRRATAILAALAPSRDEG